MIVDREFFLSFTGADRSWAVWLLAELDAAGYSEEFESSKPTVRLQSDLIYGRSLG